MLKNFQRFSMLLLPVFSQPQFLPKLFQADR